MKIKKNYLVPVLLILCGLVIIFGYVTEIYAETADEVETSSTFAEDSTQTSDSNDSIVTETTIELADYYATLKEALKQEVAGLSGEIGITYLDLTTNETVSLNGDRLFLGASTTKVPLVMLISDKVDAGALSWDQKVTYNEADYERGTGTILEDIQESYKLSELTELAITVSDNIAKNMLYSLLDGNKEGIREIYGTYLFESSNGENQMTSDDAAQILSALYKGSKNNANYQALIDDMKHTVFNNRLETALTTGAVAHKIGSIDENCHDIGIFYHQHPYVLTVYTNEVDDAAQVIAKLSDTVWKLQTSKYPS